MNDVVLIGQAESAQIDAWKMNWPDGIYAVCNDTHIAYFKNPSRLEVNFALSRASKDAPLAVVEALADKTFIGGSDLLLRSDSFFLGAGAEIKEKLYGVKAKLVNL